jgi:dATP pyrophosphohydrolase
VTGSLEAGETAADAAAREVLEETGLQPQGSLVDTGIQRTFTIDPRWLDRYSAGITENLEHEWRYCLDAPVDIQIDSSEHNSWEWVSIDAAIERVWSWTNRKALETLRAGRL